LILRHQQWHFLLLLALLYGLSVIANLDSTFLGGELFSVSTRTWIILSLASAILHQLYVLLCWRAELHYKSLTQLFGEKAFVLYKVGFVLLFVSRPLLITLLAFSNARTLPLDTSLAYLITAALVIPVVYLHFSIRRYFGFDRAVGIDHFYPEQFRGEKLVRRGIFKYSSNAMYVFGLLVLWIPGFLCQSKAALLLALFSHLYIWVHYYFTERPDMAVIYGTH